MKKTVMGVGGKLMFYYGWKVWYMGGHWYAIKHGVRMNAPTKEMIIEMIDRRRKDPETITK